MISAKLAEDLNLSCIRLASRLSFVSLLGLIPKYDSGQRRIHNLSQPLGQGLNQGIPDSQSAIKYIIIDDVYNQVTHTSLGCTIIKRDIKDAFRIVPITKDNQYLLSLIVERFHLYRILPPLQPRYWSYFSLTSLPRLSIRYSSTSFLYSILIITQTTLS